MVNFHYVLLHKGLACGPLWLDEEVYRIAKELQFLRPIKFGNIFFGIGTFHLEKVIIDCCEKYLEKSGAKKVLIQDKIYGQKTANSVMSGSHYVRCKRRMSMIAEALCHFQLLAFFDQAELDKYKTLFDTITEMKSCLK